MGEFVDAALSFPAAVFTFVLATVVVYWLLVLVGTLDVEIGDLDVAEGFGLGGVPVTVTVSVLTTVAWFTSLVGTVLVGGLVDGLGTLPKTLLGIVILLVACIAGLFVARVVAVSLRRLYVTGGEASRVDFVGRECVIRTGSVTDSFGQAEVTATDGSSAIIQVRQTGEHTFAHGHRALIFDYDTDGEFFWVAPAT